MYKHTQFSKLIFGLILALIVYFSVLSLYVEDAEVVVWVIPLFVLIILLFSWLKVEVNGNLKLAFGIGLIQRTIPFHQVKDFKKVRNSMWYGYGIRFYGKGWMWNVQGLDAIELTFVDGKKFRIGTDDPDGLLEAIRRRKV